MSPLESHLEIVQSTRTGRWLQTAARCEGNVQWIPLPIQTPYTVRTRDNKKGTEMLVLCVVRSWHSLCRWTGQSMLCGALVGWTQGAVSTVLFHWSNRGAVYAQPAGFKEMKCKGQEMRGWLTWAKIMLLLLEVADITKCTTNTDLQPEAGNPRLKFKWKKCKLLLCLLQFKMNCGNRIQKYILSSVYTKTSFSSGYIYAFSMPCINIYPYNSVHNRY